MGKQKRLIDYEEIMKLFDKQYKETAQLIRAGEKHLDNLAEGFLEAGEVIWKLPIVDAVQVIRCKDCEFFHEYTDKGKVVGSYCDRFCIYGMLPDGFCNEGEKC